MCRKLLCLVALLGIVSVASAQTVLDDFESYWGAPALTDPMFGGYWSEQHDAAGDTTLDLLGVPMNGAWMNDAWTVNGGWADPGNATDLATPPDNHVVCDVDLAAQGKSFTWGAGTTVMMDFKSDVVPSNYYIIGWNTSAGYQQTWIPGPGGGWVGWAGWTDRIPGLASYFPASMDGDPAWAEKPNLEDGEWHTFTFTPWTIVTWGPVGTDPGNLLGLEVTGFTIEAWSVGDPDTSGASGASKIAEDGTTVVWPAGPSSGNLWVDNIIVTPEPVTIGLLGLGALALIRRKR